MRSGTPDIVVTFLEPRFYPDARFACASSVLAQPFPSESDETGGKFPGTEPGLVRLEPISINSVGEQS